MPLSNKQKTIIELFEKNATNVTLATKKGNIERKTFYNWYNRNKEFAAAIDEIRESMVDFAESSLLRLMKGDKVRQVKTKELMDKKGNIITLTETTETDVLPDNASVIFYLKTKGRGRGYIERIETDNKNYNVNGDLTNVTVEDIGELARKLNVIKKSVESLP